MSEWIACLLVVGVVILCWQWKERQKETVADEAESPSFEGIGDGPHSAGLAESNASEKELEMKGTRDLLLETLTQVGCQYEIDQEDGRIYFAYQGENFQADASNDRLYITIWDVFWYRMGLQDIDEVSRLRKAVNASNLRNAVTTVFTISDEEKTMDIHCKSVFIFTSQIPDIGNYLKVELHDFFRVHHFLYSEMERLRKEETSQ